MGKGMLIDLTKCIGCRGCQTACKQWNDLPGEKTSNNGTYQNPPRFSANTYTVVTFNEVEQGNKLDWVFAKRQCMHCEKPGCASACTVGALQKSPEGPVVYDSKKCIGCRYCQYACPFGVPAFEWKKTLGLIRKCNMCMDRQGESLKPACAKTCPTEALKFDDRDALLSEAKQRIANGNGKYVEHIYGETEAGGTGMLYLSAIPFAALGFPEVSKKAVSGNAEAVMKATPAIGIGVAAITTGLYWFFKRREEGLAPAPVAAAPPPEDSTADQEPADKEDAS